MKCRLRCCWYVGVVLCQSVGRVVVIRKWEKRSSWRFCFTNRAIENLDQILHQLEHFSGVVWVEFFHGPEMLVEHFLSLLARKQLLQGFVDQTRFDLLVSYLLILLGLRMCHRLSGLFFWYRLLGFGFAQGFLCLNQFLRLVVRRLAFFIWALPMLLHVLNLITHPLNPFHQLSVLLLKLFYLQFLLSNELSVVFLDLVALRPFLIDHCLTVISANTRHFLVAWLLLIWFRHFRLHLADVFV